ncbi:DUF1360 domain-containing protein [Iamia sp.]|uniref:DUF1360 domain-containing protein n=1 Tax=Iamia sp. TaxID=2722710 RepID=UPI002B5B975B|nr:DUF1360 domain-containing protein [Iamia sp.]HXH57657.1 DUF1360 domain-containing protein [Iamia sp.]
MDPLELAVDALATYRMTRLATADIISEPWRRSVVDRMVDPAEVPPDQPPGALAHEVVDDLADPPKLARLITCRWCAGMWIAGGVVVARRLAPRAWEPIGRGLALSAVAVLLARAESD